MMRSMCPCVVRGNPRKDVAVSSDARPCIAAVANWVTGVSKTISEVLVILLT